MLRQHSIFREACLAAGTVQDRARIQACAGWAPHAFLSAIPTESELALSNIDMQLALRLRLGMPIFAEGSWCSRCRQPADTAGNHVHACNGNNTIRHDRIRDLFWMLLHRAGFEAFTEQEEPTLRHRPDLRIEHGLAPTLTYLDVSVTHSTAPSANHSHNAANSDAAVDAAWDDKVRREYAPLPRNAAFRLLPVVCTTFGGWHRLTRNFLRECASRVAAANASLPGAGALANAILNSWARRLSVCVQKQNAAMAKRCIPPDGDFGLDKDWSEGPQLLWEQACMSCACEDVAD